MKECVNGRVVASTVFAVGLVLAVWIGGNSFKHRNDTLRTVSVKGMASREFTSDLIVWRVDLSMQAHTLKDGFDRISTQCKQVEAFLHRMGITDAEMLVGKLSQRVNEKSVLDDSRDRYYTIEDGYIVSQSIEVSSSDVEKVEAADRKIGDLLAQNINVSSNSPRYYYTKLAGLKLEMLGEASADAHARAEKLVEKGGGTLGKLRNSSMGVFQIMARNGEDEYSWGGTYNTSSKEKTATITVSSIYFVK